MGLPKEMKYFTNIKSRVRQNSLSKNTNCFVKILNLNSTIVKVMVNQNKGLFFWIILHQ